MCAHVDETLHKKICNVNDTFPRIHVRNRVRIREGIFHEFRAQIYVRNLYEFAQNCMNFLHEKLVLL